MALTARCERRRTTAALLVTALLVTVTATALAAPVYTAGCHADALAAETR